MTERVMADASQPRLKEVHVEDSQIGWTLLTRNQNIGRPRYIFDLTIVRKVRFELFVRIITVVVATRALYDVLTA